MLGLIIFLSTVLLLGFPDLLLSSKNVGSFVEFLQINIIGGYQSDTNSIFSDRVGTYMLFTQYPLLFGAGIYFFYVGIIYWVIRFIQLGIKKSRTQYSYILCIFIFFLLYAASLIPLKLGAFGNRSLVLLPFFALLTSAMIYDLQKIVRIKRMIIIFFLSIVLCIQLAYTVAFLSLKIYPDPRAVSTEYIKTHIPKGSTIAVESIPIYQNIPDIAVKEIYQKMDDKNYKSTYNWVEISKDTSTFPDYVILTNLNATTTINSDKEIIVKKLQAKKYRKIAEFSPRVFGVYILSNIRDFSMSQIVPIPQIFIFKSDIIK